MMLHEDRKSIEALSKISACALALFLLLIAFLGLPQAAQASQETSLQAGTLGAIHAQGENGYLENYRIFFDGHETSGEYIVDPGKTVAPRVTIYDPYGNDCTDSFSIEVYESTYAGDDDYNWNTTLYFPLEYGNYLVVATASDNSGYVLGLVDVYESLDNAEIYFDDRYSYNGSGNFADESDLFWTIPTGAVSGPYVYADGVIPTSAYSVEYYSSSTHKFVSSSMPTSVGTYYCIVSANEDSLFAGSNYSHDFAITCPISSASVSGISSKTYTGNSITQSPLVKIGSTTLRTNTDYTIAYSNNKLAGTAKMTIVGKGYYTGSITQSFTIKKAANTITAKAISKTVKVKAASIKKKSKTLTRNVKTSAAKGSLTYKNVSSNKVAKRFKVNAKTGKVTIPAKTKRGTYALKVKVTAKGNSNFNTGSKTVSYKIRIV